MDSRATNATMFMPTAKWWMGRRWQRLRQGHVSSTLWFGARVFASVCALTSCSDSADQTKASQQPHAAASNAASAIAALEQAGKLPKLDRSPGLKGPDANQNGVRDDLDAIISAMPDSQAQKEALRQAAEALGSAIAADTRNAGSIVAIGNEMFSAIECVHRRYPAELARERLSLLEAYSVSTKERLSAYLRFSEASSGSVFSRPQGDTCK